MAFPERENWFSFHPIRFIPNFNRWTQLFLLVANIWINQAIAVLNAGILKIVIISAGYQNAVAKKVNKKWLLRTHKSMTTLIPEMRIMNKIKRELLLRKRQLLGKNRVASQLQVLFGKKKKILTWKQTNMGRLSKRIKMKKREKERLGLRQKVSLIGNDNDSFKNQIIRLEWNQGNIHYQLSDSSLLMRSITFE